MFAQGSSLERTGVGGACRLRSGLSNPERGSRRRAGPAARQPIGRPQRARRGRCSLDWRQKRPRRVWAGPGSAAGAEREGIRVAARPGWRTQREPRRAGAEVRGAPRRFGRGTVSALTHVRPRRGRARGAAPLETSSPRARGHAPAGGAGEAGAGGTPRGRTHGALCGLPSISVLPTLGVRGGESQACPGNMT